MSLHVLNLASILIIGTTRFSNIIHLYYFKLCVYVSVLENVHVVSCLMSNH